MSDTDEVEVFDYVTWDVNSDEEKKSPSRGTRDAIAKIQGARVIEGTGRRVKRSQLADGFYRPPA